MNQLEQKLMQEIEEGRCCIGTKDPSFSVDAYLNLMKAYHTRIEAERMEAEIKTDPFSDSGGWIEHDGGECPCDPEQVVEVRLKSPMIPVKRHRKAKEWGWFSSERGDYSITHWRPVTP